MLILSSESGNKLSFYVGRIYQTWYKYAHAYEAKYGLEHFWMKKVKGFMTEYKYESQ